MSYMTVETTLVDGARLFSLQSTKDVQNGAIVGKGELVTGEREIYNTIDDVTGGMYLVANPAWSYDDSRLVNQNEENFINKAGIPYRVYRLEKDMKFKVTGVATTFAVGDEVKYDPTNETYVAGTDTGLKVVAVEEVGFPYCIGSIGTQVVGDTGNEYGYATGAKTTKYTIKVM